MVGDSSMFKDLQEAIDRVVAWLDDPDCPYNDLVMVPNDDLEYLRKVANTYFVEPEDDEEFNEWQNRTE